MNDGRVAVRSDEQSAKDIDYVVRHSGRKAADVRTEAYRLGARALAERYKQRVDTKRKATTK